MTPSPAVLVDSLRSLRLFGSVLGDEIGQLLIDALVAADASTGPDKLLRLTLGVAARAELLPGAPVGDALTDWLLDRILDDDNALARKLESAPLESLGGVLRGRAILEIGMLGDLLTGAGMALAPTGAPWRDVSPLPGSPPDSERRAAKHALLAAPAPEAALDVLAAHYRRGVGLFGRSRAFRWAQGALHPVGAPDPARLDRLVGYDRERAPVLRNTEQFVAGLPANDVLIAGSRGSGKSSTVKGLLTRYGDHGLRLVEVGKADLSDLPAIVETLRPRHERFILYVDDLSFEAGEADYKALKALLEGTVEARPDNVIVYATSNRRNLITEVWSERTADSEVNPRERQEEKLSLADRFGIRVFFPAPDQALYLRIVESLAAGAGITLPIEELHQRALRWELHHSGRSGRIAHQFVVSLLGEQAGLAEPEATGDDRRSGSPSN
ncbi:MAG: ATP-binding protein [Dehalococcoidia bacterium]